MNETNEINEIIKTKDRPTYIMEFGKHENSLITDVPTKYLLWMVEADHTHKMEAVTELARRNIVVPKVKITLAAVNQVSSQHMEWYLKTRDFETEGFVDWLKRTTRLAMLYGDIHEETCEWMGFIFIFDNSGKLPILKKIKRGEFTQLELDELNAENFL